VELLRGAATSLEVVHALVLRETRTRFGRSQLGYLWALLEPSLLILTFWALFSLTHRAPPPGMDLFGFVATGVVPYTLFASSVHRVAEAIHGNKALLYYPQVRPFELVLARAGLEAATYGAVLLLLLGGRALWQQQLAVDEPLQLLAGMALASLLGSGLGALFMALGQLSATADRARGPLLRPLFWVSGIFFTAEALPERVREVFLLNPVLHAVELVRDGLYADYDAVHASAGYAGGGALLLVAAGLLAERGVRRRIEVT
jgi:capsular polysaccharide transport system permease protein